MRGLFRGWQIILAGVAQLVEHQLPKLRVAGSNPVSRSIVVLMDHVTINIHHAEPECLNEI
jgi:hypothetical protein